MSFFESQEPYEIAKSITGNNELHGDLVTHVYMIMKRKKIINEKVFFIGCAHRQWVLPQSEFNKLYRPLRYRTVEDYQFKDYDHETCENKYRDFLNEYLEKKPENLEKWYIRELVKLRMYGMTYRQIEKQAKINRAYVIEAIKQFKNDIINSYNESSNSVNIDPDGQNAKDKTF